ncbi:MAG: YkgJ family cysteine cluster protein [Promethearchaeota archaeon]
MAETKKSKFICKKSFESCKTRGIIPVVFSDLEDWAKNKILDKIINNLALHKTEDGKFEIAIVPKGFEQDIFENKNKDANNENTKETKDFDHSSCPFFDEKEAKCNIYTNRPLLCKSYPLEFDGTSFYSVDETCPREGDGELTKEERIEMKKLAELAYNELRRLRITIPILFPVMQKALMPLAKQQVLYELLIEQQKALEKMSPEEQQEFIKMQQELSQKLGKQENK